MKDLRVPLVPTLAIVAAVLLVGGLGAAAAVVYSGVYNVGSTQQHMQWVYSMLETTMRHSVQLRAREVAVPPLDEPQRIARGAACFQEKCVQCHGAPGVSQGDIGKSMQPVPGPLVDALQRWHPREVYWITRHGIKMSGMPAWEFRLKDEEIWDVVAFVKYLPTLTPEAYAAAARNGSHGLWTAGQAGKPASVCGQLVATSAAVVTTSADTSSTPPAPAMNGDVERGRQALYQYACNACHTIPGVTGSSPNVGPPLKGLASRQLIAGKLANTPEQMVQWLRHPKEIKPLTAMPDLGVTDAHARDMAAYLATLR